MSEQSRNQDLIRDVEYLKRQRIVKRDKDIVDKTGYSKGVVSSYLSGKTEASAKFLQKFYQVYGSELKQNSKTQTELNQNSHELYDFEVTLTEGKRAIIRYPKGFINLKDVEILKTAIGMIGMSVEKYVNNN